MRDPGYSLLHPPIIQLFRPLQLVSHYYVDALMDSVHQKLKTCLVPIVNVDVLGFSGCETGLWRRFVKMSRKE